VGPHLLHQATQCALTPVERPWSLRYQTIRSKPLPSEDFADDSGNLFSSPCAFHAFSQFRILVSFGELFSANQARLLENSLESRQNKIEVGRSANDFLR
jgi:hypothetical protein